MINWALSIETAPLDGTAVILATKCGKVIKSQWLVNEGRWLNLAKKEVPVAWQPWPEHPLEGRRR